MINYKELLVEKINGYSEGIISRESLTRWAKDTISDFFTNFEVLYIDNCFVYPFISDLALSESEWEAPKNDEITKIKQILDGKGYYKYSWNMKLPNDLKRESIDYIRDLFESYKGEGKKNAKFTDTIEFIYHRAQNLVPQCISDLILTEIYNILLFIPNEKDGEYNSNAWFLGLQDLKVNEHLKKAEELIECYNSNKEFQVTLYYYKENKVISLIL